MKVTRSILAGLLICASTVAWAGPKAGPKAEKHVKPNPKAGQALIKLGEALSAKDWLDPSDLSDDNQDAVLAEAQEDSPVPEPAAPAPDATPAPAAAPETPAAEPAPAPVAPEAAPVAPAPSVPLLPAVTPTPLPPGASPLPEERPTQLPQQPAGPSLLERAISLDRINIDALYEELQRSFPQEILSLSLEECVYRALKANQDILVTTFEPLKADADVLAARGIFDPQIVNETQYLRNTQSASSEAQAYGGISSIEVYQTTSQTSLQGRLPWGTGYNISLSANKEETTYTSFFEQWYGNSIIALQQPLLRGWGRGINRASIRIAENSRLVAETQLNSTVLQAVADTIRAYWDLVAAIQNVEAREKALANAERLLDISQKRLEIGTAAEIEVVQAKAGVATRQGDLISARSQVENAADLLKNLLGMMDSEVITRRRIVPVDTPDVPDEVTMNPVQSVALAMEQRPELMGAQLQIANARIEKDRQANNLLPQLDLTGSLIQGGRGHHPSDLFEGMVDRRDRGYTVGIQASVPIMNRTARGQYERARVTAKQAEQQLEQLRQNVILNVMTAIRNVETSHALVLSTAQTEALQEISLEAEEKRLELGVTTSFRVLEVEEDLTLARTQRIQAEANYEKSVSDLRLAEGTLLNSFGIEFQPPGALKPIGYFRSLIPGMAK